MTTDALPPHDLVAEKSVLGSIILDSARLPAVRAIVGPDSFFHEPYRAMFNALCDYCEDHDTLDLVLLRSWLESRKLFEKIGGEIALVEVVNAVPAPDHAVYYAKIVAEKAGQRRIWRAAFEYQRAVVGGDADAQRQALERVQLAETAAAPPSHLDTFTPAGLLAAYPTQREPIIDGLLRRGEIANLVSGPKLNKSWTVLYWALSITQGWPIWNFPTRRGRVLLLDYELAGGTLVRRITAVAAAMGLTLDGIGDALKIVPLRGKQFRLGELEKYCAHLEPGQYEAVFIDPLYRTFPLEIDENSNANLAEVFATYQCIAERLDSGLVVVHHLSKGNQSDRAVTDLGSGGGSQSRAADAHLAIRPHKEDGAAVLSGVVRSFKPFDSFAIRFDFPLWKLAPDLKPTDLMPSSRGGKGKVKETTPAEPPKPPYDVVQFVADNLTGEPQPKALIIDRAKAKAGSARQADLLLELAVSKHLAYPWKLSKSGKIGYANRPQPALPLTEPTP